MQATTGQQYGSSFGSSTVTECTCQAKNLFNYSRCYSNGVYILCIYYAQLQTILFYIFVYAVVISSTWQCFMTSGHAPLPAPNLTSRSLCQKFQRFERIGDILLGTWANMMVLRAHDCTEPAKSIPLKQDFWKERNQVLWRFNWNYTKWKYKFTVPARSSDQFLWAL